jgi:hypothetical protein
VDALRILIVLLDELVFRPAMWLINWQPSKRKHMNEYWKDDPL